MLRASEILYGTIGPTTEGWKEAWSQSVLSTWMESSTRGQNCLCSCRKGLSEITAPPNVQGLLSHSYCWTISHLLPREVVELPSLEVLKRCADMDLRPWFSGEHLVVVLHGQLDLILEIFSNLNNPMISMLYSLWRRTTFNYGKEQLKCLKKNREE